MSISLILQITGGISLWKETTRLKTVATSTSVDGIVDYVVAIAQGLKMRNPHLIYKINTFYDRLQVIIKSYNFFLAFLVLWLQSKHASAVSWWTFRRHSIQNWWWPQRPRYPVPATSFANPLPSHANHLASFQHHNNYIYYRNSAEIIVAKWRVPGQLRHSLKCRTRLLASGSRVPFVSVWIVVILDVADNLYVYLWDWNPQSAVCKRLSIRQNTANYDVNKPEKSGLWLLYALWKNNVVYEQSLH